MKLKNNYKSNRIPNQRPARLHPTTYKRGPLATRLNDVEEENPRFSKKSGCSNENTVHGETRFIDARVPLLQ
ncbi:MAG: hypothetical protein IH991_12955 [Planctomycetes bacterium]|nr:hypothetical protein [Planctomycetota bacterium]